MLYADMIAPVPELQTVQRIGAFHTGSSLLTSLLFTIAMIAIAARELSTTDY